MGGKHDDLCYYDRIRRYEDDKRKINLVHPEYTAREYEKAVKALADKWRI